MIQLSNTEYAALVAERDTLLVSSAQIDRMRAAVATAYGFLWCVNNEPGTPKQYPPERAAYEARKVLRELLTKEQRGQAINEAVAKVHEAVRGCGCREGECESKADSRCRMADEIKPSSGAQ
jgi:hypothetical protein